MLLITKMVKAVVVQFQDGTMQHFNSLTLCATYLWEEGYRFKPLEGSEPKKIKDYRISRWIDNIPHPLYGVKCIVDKHDRRDSIVNFAWG